MKSTYTGIIPMNRSTSSCHSSQYIASKTILVHVDMVLLVEYYLAALSPNAQADTPCF